MAFSLTQQNASTDAANTNTIAVTFSGTPTVGAFIVLCFNDGTAADSTGISGVCTTWTKACGLSSGRTAEIWYGFATSGTTITITRGVTDTARRCLYATEWAGGTTAILDPGVTNTNSGSGTSLDTNSVTTANAADLVVGIIGTGAGSFPTTAGPTNSFTALTRPAGTINGVAAYKIETSTETTSTGWTFTNSNTLVGAIAAFAPAAATSKLFLPSYPLNGLGNGGPFFKNPIG